MNLRSLIVKFTRNFFIFEKKQHASLCIKDFSWFLVWMLAATSFCNPFAFYLQMSLFTQEILDNLGPIPEEYANEVGKSPTITIGRPNDTATKGNVKQSHKFVEHNFLKPAQCIFCKGFIVGKSVQFFCPTCEMMIFL